MSELWWPAPAKLNRFLHITGRREDGYHTLQTVFQFLDYGDRLSFRIREDGKINRAPEIEGVAPESDLCVRAAKLLQRRAGCSKGVDIVLEKHTPMGGGLGGGSSDAATTLVALNYYWNLAISRDELARLGLAVGADVPVFVHGHAAWAEGVGDELYPISPDEPWFLVIDPGVNVSTAEVFNDIKLTRHHEAIRIRAFPAGQTTNDCEIVVFENYPEVESAARFLSRYGQARMSGTGACVFVGFAHKRSAENALGEIPAAWRGFVARGCNRSPLYTRSLLCD